ncbi:AMP-forming long-chain acyl-CoA synthetase [Ignavibacterium album JCM 16511]|uniref:AMP-forming long-chain acyl-CoA synthetase n=1 Tax=Ignavibacterium album (strain DSM 19864 / JCM 16511 / NBRC 101810 / Mat9-16) TaxID=945713 RepID=I0APD6_IGNAJ|nr:AMP-binding protein [Ignavibacterium album]AFH50843.1 AMP-forming long-chain acyl-CoA synthetase [Ignavibacterium album JCM 16511]
MVKKYALYDVPKISSIQDMLLRSANEYSDKIALEDLNDYPIPKVTYKELRDFVFRFGKALNELGLKERDHIAVIGENRVQWGITYLTAMTFNMVIVPIDKNLTTNEILNIIHESDANAIVFSNTFKEMLLEKKSSLLKLKYLISMDDEKNTQEVYSMIEMIEKQNSYVDKLPKIDPTEMAEIIFTSGSLGRAKGVMLSQKNLAANLMSMTSMIKIDSEDRFLSVLPIHHTYECTCGFLCPLYAGASAHYARSLKTVVDDLQKVKATIMLGVPLLYDKIFKRIYKGIQEDKVKSKIVPPLVKLTNIADAIGWKSAKKIVFGELHKRFGGSIRLFIAGGAAPDPKVAKGLREFGFNFVQGYGLTETAPILALNRLYAFKDNAAGLPLPGVQIKINNPDNDGVGEIFVKGDNVMLGYYKNPQLTQEVFENSWFKTGDLGFFDEDGFLHIAGRKKNVIIANNGKNVFPEEIEDLLNRSPFIQECMVYGEKDEKHDEVIAAQIVTDAEAFIEYSEKNNIQITPELVNNIISEEIKKVNKELANYKQIRKFYIRETEFEKTTTQKIKRYLVKHQPE